jgi:CRP-like cAMP-binding protein/RsiW-degrading membrane proteinase PrsW (M82 family)
MEPVTIIAYIIAIAIPAFTVYVFFALDVFGTGKSSTILLCMAWGAIGAFLLAWMINNWILDQGLGYETLTRIAAPIIEEILKALVLVYLVQQPRFRYIVDGAVYGIAVGIGFGLSENMFIYLPGSGSAVLGTAISRTLSTALMHAAASGIVGISLGRLRRTTTSARNVLPLMGIAFAIALHVVYNNIAGELTGVVLLLVAIGIGVGGGVVIAWQISQGLADEKQRFAQTLGLNVGVSTGERRAVQQLGGASIEQIFGELNDFFGGEHVNLIRRLLVIQANIGILQNNLNSPTSERLRSAWQEEIAEYRTEIEALRKQLGSVVSLFMQSVFPVGDQSLQQALNEEMGEFDPTLVHTFDMFMRSAELAGTFTPEQLAEMAERLHKIEIFKNVSLANLENLSRAIDAVELEDGQVLFQEGEPGDAMYLIEQGAVDISVREHTGEQKLFRTFQPGDVIGEFSLLDGGARSASATASGPVRLLRLQRQVFMMFVQSRPQVIFAMLQYLVDKIRYTQQTVESSVIWMEQIAEGVYLPHYPAPAVEEEAAALSPADVPVASAEQVGRVFSKAAAALQERERSMQSGQASA